MTEPLYYSKDGVVWKRPIEHIAEDGSVSATMGFPICTIHEIIGAPDSAAQQIADALNAAESAS